ncbi:MAG: SHOCT domain-containing protein [Phaeodactylibacter sp.]|nr:SHOCT domain-containing protein [Phaeodactylibacter sp.]
MHFYDGYHFWGMHLLWWGFWIVLLIVIFATPWLASGRRRKAESPLEILKKRYAAGDLSTEEYKEQKAVLEEEEGLKI